MVGAIGSDEFIFRKFGVISLNSFLKIGLIISDFRSLDIFLDHFTISSQNPVHCKFYSLIYIKGTDKRFQAVGQDRYFFPPLAGFLILAQDYLPVYLYLFCYSIKCLSAYQCCPYFCHLSFRKVAVFFI